MEAHAEKSQAADNLWTVDEVAACLRCTVRHVHNLCRPGLPHVHVARLLWFDAVEVRPYVLTRRRIADGKRPAAIEVTTRTGCYAVPTSTTEDGFAPEPTRSSGAVITLTKYHSADSNRDGKLSLLELTRVIELYNYRSGTTRTGQYRVQAGTEDGFSPGP